jgi:threonine/homoserine/homoserine lactone efflux protein
VGLAALFAISALAFQVVKFAGAAYLIYLGIQAVLHRRGGPPGPNPSRPATTRRILREGFVVGATNPKSVVFFVAVLPQFVDHSAGAIPLQLALLGATFLAIALVSDSVWALAAGTARQWFARSPRRVAAVTTTGGVMMIGLGGTLALTGSKS